MSEVNLLAVLGATASGKTSLAVQLARALNGEIISADSRQVYRGMDIGTGKDLAEYQEIKHHLIDIVDPGDEYSVFDYQQHFIDAFDTINNSNKLAILAGGSALYADAILKGYRLIEVPTNPTLREELCQLSIAALKARLLSLKPNQHNTTDLLDRDRLYRAIEIAEGEKESNRSAAPFPKIVPHVMAIKWQRETLKNRITARLKARLTDGLIEEVSALNHQGVSWETLHFYGLEYRFVSQYLQGQLNRNDMVQKLNSAIHLFAKKQQTWLRRLEKEGVNIHWLDGNKDTFNQALNSLQSVSVKS
ncbi:tRNA (adenosine(37)-N6)-dimethylallyltransferase MiaA [Thalassotalea sp. G2M2-11]|uniref:tRNA (adenosine(37)-N6)-dimethylallyltransferase MiaA n=1 Tax=Thalassotalea sp. G2M2-11 TaxID=2787627 RepID=UPI0019D17DB3|nr:tRNA (adenosine(37)-N6)-dimethylallyltransferase MiaA [Thalassotalea sp. G2M2-11]